MIMREARPLLCEQAAQHRQLPALRRPACDAAEGETQALFILSRLGERDCGPDGLTCANEDLCVTVSTQLVSYKCAANPCGNRLVDCNCARSVCGSFECTSVQDHDVSCVCINC